MVEVGSRTPGFPRLDPWVIGLPDVPFWAGQSRFGVHFLLSRFGQACPVLCKEQARSESESLAASVLEI